MRGRTPPTVFVRGNDGLYAVKALRDAGINTDVVDVAPRGLDACTVTAPTITGGGRSYSGKDGVKEYLEQVNGGREPPVKI